MSLKYPATPILVIDDDQDIQSAFKHILKYNGMDNVEHCLCSREAEDMLKSRRYELVVLDLNMPDVNGRELLKVIGCSFPDLPVVVVTGVDDVKTAVQCIKEGAVDYLVKPVTEDILIGAIRKCIALKEIKEENERLKESLLTVDLAHPDAFARILTRDKTMQSLFHYIEAVAGTNQPVLVAGETGVGKELFAKAFHLVSGRPGSFVPVNTAGLDDNMFSLSLFGHVSGYTGASEHREGLIEQAADGTLFLDEIGGLSIVSQVKLLRLLQEREYFPVGAHKPKRTNAAIVVATNKNLAAMKDAGEFRDDLYFRLRAHRVVIPPLRERKDDISLLVDHFLSCAAKQLGTKKPTVPRELITLLRAYSFPGNVRELEAMCFNAVSTHKAGIISLNPFKTMMDHLPSKKNREAEEHNQNLISPDEPLPTMKDAQSILIDAAMKRTEGNQTMAAQLLGITRQTLIRHIKRDVVKKGS